MDVQGHREVFLYYPAIFLVSKMIVDAAKP